MSSALKFILTGLTVLLLCIAAHPAQAQPQGRPKPDRKKAGTPPQPGQTAADRQDETGPDPERAAALFEEGQNAHQAGRLEEAVKLYSEALRLDETLWQAGYQHAAACLALNRLPEAEASINQVIAQLDDFPDAPDVRAVAAKARLTLGEILLAAGRSGPAESAFRQVLEADPAAARAHAGLAQILLAGNRISEAISAVEAAISAGDERASTRALLGAALLAERRYDEALAALNDALQRDAQNAAALRYRAEVFLARGDYARAAADLQAALGISENTATRLRLAEVYARAGKPDEAVRLAREVLTAEPANTAARNLITAATIESADAGAAIAQLEAMLSNEPDRADVRAQLAEKYLATDPEKALQHAARAAELEPGNLKHQISAGAALLKLRRFQETAETMRRVLAQNPPAELAYFARTNLATSLFEMDDYAQAAREFIWILNNQTDRKKAAVTLFFLGVCFDRLGDFEQALRAYEQFLGLATAENQLEIDKVKLRMEPLKRQLEKTGGKKKKKQG